MVHPQAGAGINGGVGAAPEGGGASRVTVYIEVGDIEQALARIEELGGHRVVGPVGVAGGPTIALFADPEGHVIGLTRAATVQPG
jgi:predicted enzyme related to lactoylglutathione lyase